VRYSLADREEERPMDIVGERILLARRRRGIQQKVLAELAQISPKHLSQIETGKVAGLHMQAELLRRIAQTLGVSADYLLGLDASEQEPPAEQAASNGSRSKGQRQAKGRAKAKA
jgi:transcriptional regulator with XRE-family HTH domain